MQERFEISELHICTFKLEEGFIQPELKNYPRRLCVIDKQRGIVVDVKHKLEYDYIETMSGIYFINKSVEKIKENKRAAIFPSIIFLNSIDDKKNLESAKEIIEYLSLEKKYQDGNLALSNEEYLEKIQKEQKNSKSRFNKIKKIGKKQK